MLRFPFPDITCYDIFINHPETHPGCGIGHFDEKMEPVRLDGEGKGGGKQTFLFNFGRGSTGTEDDLGTGRGGRLWDGL